MRRTTLVVQPLGGKSLNADGKLQRARKEAMKGFKERAAMMIVEAAEELAREGKYKEAAQFYEEAASLYKEAYRAEECFAALENAALMFVRLGMGPENNREIVRINKTAAEIALIATEFETAANFLFRAIDFAESENEKRDLLLEAIDALQQQADMYEEEEKYDRAVGTLKKIARLFITIGDDELGERVYEKAIKIAMRWSEIAQERDDLATAASALAEAAQLMQLKGNAPEAPRIMLKAGDLYSQAGMYEKAGNIYDAAQEAYKLERNTSARRKAMNLAAESYLKMEGKPEVVAPLLMKAGALFNELGNVKAKWAYKRAAELFEQLSKRAREEGDIESEKVYLRYMAMSLKQWGDTQRAEQIYNEVVQYFLEEAEREARAGNKERHAISLEEAYEVLLDARREEDAKTQLEKAVDIYIELATELAEDNQFDDASKFFSKAATCAEKLGDMSRAPELFSKASKYAMRAAEFYQQLGVDELAALWLRTAAQEAIKTERIEMIEKAIEFLKRSAKKFEEINAPDNAFDDLFTLFETLFLYYPDKREEIAEVLKSLDRVAILTRDEPRIALSSMARYLDEGNHIGALLLYQEREEELVEKRDRILALIAQSKRVRSED